MLTCYAKALATPSWQYLYHNAPRLVKANCKSHPDGVALTVLCFGGMVLQMTPAVRNMIRDSKNHMIPGAIAAGGPEGMISMDQSILQLYQAGRISRQTALTYADNPEQLQRRMEV